MKQWNLTSQELDFIYFQTRGLIGLAFLYFMIVVCIQVTLEWNELVSFESKSGKKTAKFRIKLNYVFLAFLQVIPYPVSPGIQGYCIAVYLMVVLSVRMKRHQSRENGDRKKILECNDCVQVDVLHQTLIGSSWFFFIIITPSFMLEFKDLTLSLPFGYSFMTGCVIGMVLVSLGGPSSSLVSNRIPSDLSSKWLAFAFDVESQDFVCYKNHFLFLVYRIEDCSHEKREFRHKDNDNEKQKKMKPRKLRSKSCDKF